MSELATRRSSLTAGDAGGLDVGIVHDYVTQKGGAERVVLELLRAFPGAPLYTSLYDPDGTFDGYRRHAVSTSPLNAVPLFRRSHRAAFPAFAPTFSKMRVRHDVVVCSSSGWAHGARVEGVKVVYCHAPARWLYQGDRYTRGDWKAQLALTAMVKPLRTWDRVAMRSADVLLANSVTTRDAVRDVYGLSPVVVHPPHGAPLDVAPEPLRGIEPGFFLVVSRLLPYKNVDAVIAAFAHLPHQRLVVAGTGPDAEKLAAAAGRNVTMVGMVSDAELAWLYESARGLVAASYEDFGLTPLEAAAFGKPTAALWFGGYRETVRAGRTGVFFERPEPRLIAEAVTDLDGRRWDARTLQEQAEAFSPSRFRDGFHAAIEHAVSSTAGLPSLRTVLRESREGR